MRRTDVIGSPLRQVRRSITKQAAPSSILRLASDVLAASPVFFRLPGFGQRRAQLGPDIRGAAFASARAHWRSVSMKAGQRTEGTNPPTGVSGSRVPLPR